MFVKAIEEIDKFTKPIHTITRTYGGLLSPATSTMFFVNEEGVAVTCKHVLELFTQGELLNNNYNAFKLEKAALPRNGKYNKKLKELEGKYGLNKDSIIQIKNQFINSVLNFTTIQYHAHPTLDLALIKFQGEFEKIYDSYATFISNPDKIKQGRYLCRLGYPFPEFNNFVYNAGAEEIEWTANGNMSSPRFPLDGIITRFSADNNTIATIEMSTPGLKGQSGGPLFDSDSFVYGMQSMTGHLHLGFDIKDKEVIDNGKKFKVTNHPFLHVGHCIHVDRIKEFLTQNNIKFYQEN